MSELRLGTRGSVLALTQSRVVADLLQERGHAVTIEVIPTTGDRDQTQPLPEIGGKGLFTRELDLALLKGRIDVAVHSLKDLPTELEPGLTLACVPEREDPRDVMIAPASRPVVGLHELEAGARVGTSSLRRHALLRAFRPDLEVASILGNLDTRLAKLDREEFDVIIVAAAGVRRLGLWQRVGEALERTSWLPAPGQGALAVVTRSEDTEGRSRLGGLDHAPSHLAVRSERALLAALGGGCQTPIAALGLPYDSGLRLWALVASPDGSQVVRADATGRVSEPEALGGEVAKLLLRRGAAAILEAIPPDAVPRLSHA